MDRALLGGACLASCAAAIAFVGCHGASDTISIDRTAIELTLVKDGTLQVSEHIEFRALTDDAVFQREVRQTRVDRLTFVSATLDGRGGEDANRALRVRDGDALTVRWSLPEGSRGTAHAVDLRYIGLGAVALRESRGFLEWHVLPVAPGVGTAAAHLRLTLPAAAQELGPTGIAQAGWTVVREAHGISAQKAPVSDEPTRMIAEFSIDPQAIAMPAWQTAQDQRSEFALAFVSGALFVLVTGAGVIWIVWFQHPRIRVPAGHDLDGPSLTAELTAALQRPPVRWTTRAGRVERLELERSGLLDPDRVDTARGLRIGGHAVAVFGLGCAVVSGLVLERYDWWAQLVPASILIVAAMLLVAARRLGVFTERGERTRAIARSGAGGDRSAPRS